MRLIGGFHASTQRELIPLGAALDHVPKPPEG
jgi:hypothetical protein